MVDTAATTRRSSEVPVRRSNVPRSSHGDIPVRSATCWMTLTFWVSVISSLATASG